MIGNKGNKNNHKVDNKLRADVISTCWMRIKKKMNKKCIKKKTESSDEFKARELALDEMKDNISMEIVKRSVPQNFNIGEGFDTGQKVSDEKLDKILAVLKNNNLV